jgi:hypothetical protein
MNDLDCFDFLASRGRGRVVVTLATRRRLGGEQPAIQSNLLPRGFNEPFKPDRLAPSLA